MTKDGNLFLEAVRYDGETAVKNTPFWKIPAASSAIEEARAQIRACYPPSVSIIYMGAFDGLHERDYVASGGKR
jgi:hypothetical protein